MIISIASYTTVLVFICFVAGTIVFDELRQKEENKGRKEFLEVMSAIFCACIIFSFILMICMFFAHGLKLFNPEYHAISDLIRLVK